MKKLEKEELELFYRLDKKKYLVVENQELNNLLIKIPSLQSKEDIQDFIDKLACWYFVKLPDNVFQSVENINVDILQESNQAMNLNTLFNNFNTFEFYLVNFDNFEEKEKEVTELLCQYLLTLAGYKMIYYKNSSPEYGIIRTKFMFQEFNDYFNWDLNINIYNDIINRDYSLDNQLNVLLLQNLRETQTKSKKKREKRKSRRFFHF